MEKEYQEYNENQDPFAGLDEGLCQRCRRRSIDRSENPESQLCRDCREELIKLRIPPYFYIIGAVALLLMVFTFSMSAGSFKNLESYANSGDLAEEGYVISAMDNLLSLLEENPDNKQAAIKLADIGMKYGYYDYAAFAIDEYLAGKEVSDGQYEKLSGYIRKLDIYYDTQELNDEIWESVYSLVGDEEDVEAILGTYSQEMSSYIGNTAYDQALLYYYMGYMSLDEETGNACFEECLKANPHYYDAYAQIANSYRRSGDFETARRKLEEAYRMNKEDYSVLRALATLALAEGRLDEGLDFAGQAYGIYPEGDYVIDTYIVALAANGSMEQAKALVEAYEETGIFDEGLYAFLDGKITLEDYYVGE